MKRKLIYLSIAIFTMAVFFVACEKDDKSSVNFTTLENEQSITKTALATSQLYNDTLMMVYDTAKVRKNNSYCIKYDKLYHKNDSMFSMHYKLFGDEMYKNGVMMGGYTSSGMMGGGMMNGNMMDTARMHRDTSMMNGYYNNIMHLHNKHLPYHNGIYN